MLHIANKETSMAYHLAIEASLRFCVRLQRDGLADILARGERGVDVRQFKRLPRALHAIAPLDREFEKGSARFQRALFGILPERFVRPRVSACFFERGFSRRLRPLSG